VPEMPSRFVIPASFLALALALSPSPRGVAAPPDEAPPQIIVGRPVEIRGEVVSLDCFLREGSRGEAHRSCALASLAHGGSLAIVEDDSAALYPLAGDTPASDPSAQVRDLLAQHVVVVGKLYERARGRILVAERVRRMGN
jgi:hypothetical protein